MSRRSLTLLAVLTIVALALGACAAPPTSRRFCASPLKSSAGRWTRRTRMPG